MSQNADILKYLQSGGRLTAKTAISRFRCYRLAARICDLRDDGYQIETETIKRKSKRTGKPVAYAAYSIPGTQI